MSSTKRKCPSEAPEVKKRRGPTYGQDQVWVRQDGKTEFGIQHMSTLIKNVRANATIVPAVYHHKIRQELLEAAPTGNYGELPGWIDPFKAPWLTKTDFPATGWGNEDVTSFLESQKTWGPERANYPTIVFEYKPPSQRNDPEYEPKEWFHNGCLVLDRYDRPMIRFRDIPDVLSSTFPGYAAEAIQRIDSRITLTDILMRMPKTVKSQNGKETELSENTLIQRTHRFRLKAGCVAWNERRSSKAIEEFLEEHLPASLKEANTTLGFRDLTPDEMKHLEKANGKRFPKKREAAAVGTEELTLENLFIFDDYEDAMLVE